MNTLRDPSSTDNPGEGPPPPSNARSSTPGNPLRVFIGLVLIVSALNYLLFRVFAPSTGPRGIVIAAFRADFQPEQPKAGWRYLWNANGSVGQATNYSELRWNGTIYVPNETMPFPGPGPAHYLRISHRGGHPGYGPAQDFQNSRESCAIAAFTVREGARHWLTNSFLARPAGARRGSVHLRVFVNDVEKGPSVYCSDKEGVSFDRPLGVLSAGDTVYVAIGANETDVEDSFDLDFALVR